MQGQWVGEFTGTNRGLLILNIEYRDSQNIGNAIYFDFNRELPSFYSEIEIRKTNSNIHIVSTALYPVKPWNGLPAIDESAREKVKEYYKNISFPSRGNMVGTIDGDVMSGDWNTDTGTGGVFELKLSNLNQPSKLSSKKRKWHSFKKEISTLETEKFIYRGQSKPWKLSTSFHRAGRTLLPHYWNEEFVELNRYMSSIVPHVFRLHDLEERGALLHLAQHHGFPTPLLDWTYSPFVAAFFAYADIPKNKKKRGNVRIFKFNIKKWIRTLPQVPHPLAGYPTLTALKSLAIENKRILPQQSVSIFSNIVDIEMWIRLAEQPQEVKYLEAIDLPISERNLVMQELNMMGITHASLFPGLDGICKTLKEKYF